MILPWRPVAIGDGPPIQTSLTMCETSELQQLAHDTNVIEVGAAFGFSTVAMAMVGRMVVSIDPHAAHGSRRAFEDNLRAYGVLGKIIIRDEPSQSVLAQSYPSASWGLIFIDGDHQAEAVEHDIRHALRLSAPGGHIAVHDYGEDTCPDVKPVCDRLLPGGRLVDTLWVAQTS